MSAAEYACDFWNGVPTSAYSYPQQFNMDLQMMENNPFRNYQLGVYPETNQSSFSNNYNNPPTIKTENVFNPCSYPGERVQSSSGSPPAMIPIVEQGNNLNRLLECCQKNFDAQCAVKTREDVNIRFSEEKMDDSPALRALLTKPPLEKLYGFTDNRKQCIDNSQIYRDQDQGVKNCEKPFEYDRRSAKPLPSPIMDNCSSEEGDSTQNNCDTNQMPNYYPWMKTQGKNYSIFQYYSIFHC